LSAVGFINLSYSYADNQLTIFFWLISGLLIGGKIDHQCSLERGVGYYLEPLMCLGAFCKNPLEVSLHGVTNNQHDPSPDLLKQSAMPVLKR
jgi:RNA 3'-terminal phosphate cyclase-like protein